MILGFNIGRLGKPSPSFYSQLGCNAIEINLGRIDDVERYERMKNLTAEELAPFEHVSLHAPVGKISYGKNDVAKRVLDDIQGMYERLRFKHAVVHPHMVEDWSVFKNYSFPVATENMDDKKEVGRTVESLKEVFSKADILMVLDLNHCYVNDRTIQLAADMYAEFKDRVVQIHLSGFKTFHEPLCQTKQVEIIEAIPNKDLPIILESSVTSEEEVRAEYEYVKENL